MVTMEYTGLIVYNFMINSMNQSEICVLTAHCIRFFVAISVQCVHNICTNIQMYRCFALFVCQRIEREIEYGQKQQHQLLFLPLPYTKKAFHNTILIHLNGTNRFHIQYLVFFSLVACVCVCVCFYALFCFRFATNADDSTCANAFFNCELRTHSFSLARSLPVSVTQSSRKMK